MKNKTLSFSEKESTLTIPFYFEATKKPNNDGFPQTFPFNVRFDKQLKIFRQVHTKSLEKILNKAYLTGTMLSGGMNDVYIGKSRIDAAEKFIQIQFKKRKDVRVFEIGCGEGQILERLAKLDMNCTGLEPGPQISAIKNKKISIINDFFPSKKIEKNFDLILHFGVLEHMREPVEFLRQSKKYLSKNGMIIFGVPDCEADLAEGDISLFLHEHYNYFTKTGIVLCASKAGFAVKHIEKSPAGGMFHVVLVPKKKGAKKPSSRNLVTPKKFTQQANRLKKAIDHFFDDVSQNDVAIYCPLRCMNLLSVCGITDCRLIDDNPTLFGKFLPTFRNKIENFKTLESRPPKKILIYSKTYDKVIKKKCKQSRILSKTNIRTISEIS